MQNLHTHTTYVDGILSAEEMILAALKKGCDSLGFSEHSFIPFDADFSMTPDMTKKYIDELVALKKKYSNDIEIFIGLEIDYYTMWKPDEGLDYILGAAHNLKVKDRFGNYKFVSVDANPESQKQVVDTYFDGDFYTMAEAYYEILSDITQVTNADIIAHFDLVAKFNHNNSVFDEQHPRYLNAALDAMDAILDNCKIFEVNTGAMYRGNKSEPYPSAFLLKELFKRGGEVVLGSDSHDGDSICFAFDEVSDLLKSCGFRYQKRLTKTGFIDVEL